MNKREKLRLAKLDAYHYAIAAIENFLAKGGIYDDDEKAETAELSGIEMEKIVESISKKAERLRVSTSKSE